MNFDKKKILKFIFPKKVGKTWYEIEGTTIEDKGSSNRIALSDGLTSKYGAEPEKVSTLYATKDSLWIFIGFLVLAFGWGLFNKKLWLIISFLVLALILRWALFNEKPGKGGIQQLRVPNFTQLPPPLLTSSGQTLIFYILSTLCHVTPIDFLLTPSTIFMST